MQDAILEPPLAKVFSRTYDLKAPELTELPKDLAEILKTPERPSRNLKDSRKTSTKLPKRISAQLKRLTLPSVHLYKRHSQNYSNSLYAPQSSLQLYTDQSSNANEGQKRARILPLLRLPIPPRALLEEAAPMPS